MKTQPPTCSPPDHNPTLAHPQPIRCPAWGPLAPAPALSCLRPVPLAVVGGGGGCCCDSWLPDWRSAVALSGHPNASAVSDVWRLTADQRSFTAGGHLHIIHLTSQWTVSTNQRPCLQAVRRDRRKKRACIFCCFYASWLCFEMLFWQGLPLITREPLL